MRRYGNFLIVGLAAVATGCIYGREPVRDDRPLDVPPPPPVADYSTDSGYPGSPSYQTEAPPPPAGSDVASEAVFYERLSPYGYWTFVEPYGRVWVPAVGYGWRPYYYGQWVLTDWGWTFVSDDPWGWAAYHYGRWNWAVGVGWYWIPGYLWAPAWVYWRYGGGYVTWCPIGPAGVVFGYRHPAWIAVSETHFTRPIAAVALPAQRTSGVVNQARPLAGVHATVGRTGTFGPPVTSVARATGQQIRPMAVAQAVRPRPVTAGRGPAVMRSPIQARPRLGTYGRLGPAWRNDGGPRTVPAGLGGASAPRSGAPSGGAPSAAPGGGSGPRPSAGGGHGGGPHVTSGKPR